MEIGKLLEAKRDAVLSIAAKYGAQNVRVFGSVLFNSQAFLIKSVSEASLPTMNSFFSARRPPGQDIFARVTDSGLFMTPSCFGSS